ncbi:MAG: hypothetical protein LLG20_08620 [Acidobacteriales bacterium]|nr:hypothetical protein [Terriglobales bacterium]
MRLVTAALFGSMSLIAADPKTICFSTAPNAYLTDHAAEIKKSYDGFFFNGGSWEDAAKRFVGVNGAKPEAQAWMDEARRNLAALRRAGATENFLTILYPGEGEWPTPERLLSSDYTKHKAEQYAAIGLTARRLGFRGVCIDIEYPYPRYDLDNPIYRYENYTAGQLTKAAHAQGRAVMHALLDTFPEAVVILLPGGLRDRVIPTEYQVGMLETMTERDAPGGFHLGTEFSYYVRDDVTSLATTRFEDPAPALLAGRKVMDYWRRRCSMAPGVWPTHMVETPDRAYPEQPWKKEVEELRRQVTVLRSTAKRYIWSYSGAPMWYAYTPEVEQKYKLTKPKFRLPDIDARDWLDMLASHPRLEATSPLQKLVAAIQRYDRGEISSEQLCDAFGTPGRWWVLGKMSNLLTKPAFAGMDAPLGRVSEHEIHRGRDGGVRWFRYDNLDPIGITSPRTIFGFSNVDDSGAHLVTNIHSPEERKAILHFGWDDGARLYLGGKILVDALEYPPKGKGMVYKEKFLFEKHIPVTIPKGVTRLAVTTMNLRGKWLYSLRLTDGDGIPFDDIRFRLE